MLEVLPLQELLADITSGLGSFSTTYGGPRIEPDEKAFRLNINTQGVLQIFLFLEQFLSPINQLLHKDLLDRVVDDAFRYVVPLAL